MRREVGMIGGAGMVLVASVASGSQPIKINSDLIRAMIMVESGGDDRAVGDKNLQHKAYGCLQIRQPFVDDVNEIKGTKHRAQECLGDRELSLWLFHRYMERYATRKRLGREPTSQDIARIHNGGPNGYRLKSTLSYWRKVEKALEAVRREKKK